jgi:hypothetical protein
LRGFGNRVLRRTFVLETEELTEGRKRLHSEDVHNVYTSPNIVKSKGKVVPVLLFNLALRHEGVLGELRYSSTHSLTSALDGSEWSASGPGRFTPRERSPDTHWIGGWVDPRAVVDAVVKRKIPNPHLKSNPRIPIVQPVSQRYY